MEVDTVGGTLWSSQRVNVTVLDDGKTHEKVACEENSSETPFRSEGLF